MAEKKLIKNKYKTTQRFEQGEIDPLLSRTKGNQIELHEYRWINNLSSKEAEEELVQRFYNLGKGLVRILLTGKYNFKSSFEQSFLRYFCSTKTPLINVATALKKELSIYGSDEIVATMDLAIRQAIQSTESNLASTIIIKLHDLVEEMIKNSNNNKVIPYEDSKEVHDESHENVYSSVLTEISILQVCTPKELEVVKLILLGRKVRMTKTLRKKLEGIFID